MRFVSYLTFVFIDCLLIANENHPQLTRLAFHFVSLVLRGVSETLPLKIFREPQVALSLKCDWCMVCRETKDNFEF